MRRCPVLVLLLLLCGWSAVADRAAVTRSVVYAQDAPALQIDVRAPPYNAKCDGVTDDSVALQAAFDAADVAPNRVVKLPAKTCAFNTPLTVGNAFPSYSHVMIEGVNRDVSILAYGGANTEIALNMRHLAYFEMKHFSVIRSGARGTSIGINLERSSGGGSGAGTQIVTGTLWHIGASGFNIGMRYGGSDSAASEIQCWHCQFSNNDTGWSTLDFNSLNFSFFMLGISQNGCGMYLSGESPMIIGGHSALNTTGDFCLNGPFGSLTVKNFRAEVFSQFVTFTALGDRISISDSLLTFATPTITVMELAASQAVLERNDIQGKVVFTGVGEFVMLDNQVDESTPLGPATVSATGGTVRVRFKGNTSNTTGQRQKRFPDFEGIVNFGTASPLLEQRVWIDDTPGGGVDIRAARSLAYGSPNVRGANLRDRVTFATSATANFTFKRTLSVTTTASSVTISFASGAMTAADIGKTIVVPDVLTDCVGMPTGTDDDWFGRIITLPSATTATVYPMQWAGYETDGVCRQASPDQSETQTATIGEDEPDANYMITGISCSATGETVGWSNIATTGFTLTSTNASSTNVCNVTLMR